MKDRYISSIFSIIFLLLSFSAMWNEEQTPTFFRNSGMSEQRQSSVKSLQRPSFQDHSPSRHKSMVYVMSVQSDRKSDIYERLISLQQRRRQSKNRRSGFQKSGIQKVTVDRKSGIEQNHPQEINRRSGANTRIGQYHQCACFDDCQENCPCKQNVKQMCIRGICCQQCIIWKNKYMRTHKGCLCKNSKCLKMYCNCYVNNIPCGKQCKCTGCENTYEKHKKTGLNNFEVKIPYEKNKSNQQPQQYCSCRKTHCLKKYCTCYVNGRKCGKYCQCQKCHNKGEDYGQGDFENEEERQEFYLKKERYGRHDVMTEQLDQNIDQYLEEQDYNEQIPKDMEFQPVSFQQMLNKMKMNE